MSTSHHPGTREHYGLVFHPGQEVLLSSLNEAQTLWGHVEAVTGATWMQVSAAGALFDLPTGVGWARSHLPGGGQYLVGACEHHVAYQRAVLELERYGKGGAVPAGVRSVRESRLVGCHFADLAQAVLVAVEALGSCEACLPNLH